MGLKSSDEVSASDDAFYSEARNWEASRIEALERGERRAWWVAIVAVVMALMAVAALAFLAPLKQAVPFLVYVDRFSGDTQVREAMDARVQFSDVLDKHWLVQYVMSHERYQWDLLQADYDRTLAWSDKGPAREYSQQFDGPRAIYKVLGRTRENAVRVVSVSVAPHPAGTPAVATVRFVKTVRNLETGVIEGTPAHEVATIGYLYRISPLTTEKALIMNPLGFTVTAYRVDPELADVVPQPSAPGDSINAKSVTGTPSGVSQ
ncbi:Type IV secretion system protein virB8 [Ralstonia psammae]|uniref:Type IV secretion system protein virB8 n=2 Tax=Ralstonia psammae TaxID=3058598 RepID=A0ABM9K0Q2_9RALS|nr:Type IV secretion system protein virB8 [Ralstonia sp. LMG 19083]